MLDPEQARDVPRSKRFADRVDFPEPMLDEIADEQSGERFLRERQRGGMRRRSRSSVQSRFSWTNRWVQVSAALIVVAALGLIAAATWEGRSVLLHNRRFLLRSSGNIQFTGNRVVSAREVLEVFAPDLGHSIFGVPLAKRRVSLQHIPWVRRATVMRLWPNHLRVHVVERTPIAFARDGDAIRLVDDEGVLLDLSDAAAQHYSFPVLTGVSSSEPLSTRAARIEMYRQFVHALDAGGENVSATLSEVDLSDPEDVRAVFEGGAHPPLVHFGINDFLPRYRAYQAHLAEWVQQYPKLRSVDMRYGRQVVLDTGMQPAAGSTGIGEAAAANSNQAADGVPARNTSAAKGEKKSAPRKRTVRPRHHVAVHRHARSKRLERGHRVRRPIIHVVTGI